jgi:hypothetical protein
MMSVDEDDCLRPADEIYSSMLISNIESEMDSLINLLKQKIITKQEFNEIKKSIEHYSVMNNEFNEINMEYLYEKNIIENEIYLEKLFDDIKKSVEIKREFYNTSALALMTYLNRMKYIDNTCSNILEIIQNIIIYDNIKIESEEKRKEIIDNIHFILNNTSVSRKINDEIKQIIIDDFEKHLQL